MMTKNSKKQSDDIDPKIKELQDQIDELKNKYLRALADYQNLEKRTQEERAETRQFAAESIVTRLLPVLDGLEKAVVHLKDPGLELILKEFYAVLRDNGVAKIAVSGKPFDPREMECIEVVEGPEDQVIEEVEAGYVLHNRVIRVARVKVGKAIN